MKSKTKQIFLSGIILGLFLLTASSSMAVPALKTIRLAPTTPQPEDTVTFTATIDYYDFATSVKLVVEECNEGFCYADAFNVSMTDKGEGEYEKQITLKHEEATEIKYHVAINSEFGWQKSNVVELDLDLSGDGGDNGGSTNGDSDNKSPGFELVILFAAVFIGLILAKKRYK